MGLGGKSGNEGSLNLFFSNDWLRKAQSSRPWYLSHPKAKQKCVLSLKAADCIETNSDFAESTKT